MRRTPAHPSILATLALLGATVGLALLLGGCPTDQRAVETEAAKAIGTTLAQGQKYVATLLAAARDTAVAAAATEAAHVRQTLEAGVATGIPRAKETALAAAATQAAQLRQTLEAGVGVQLPAAKDTALAAAATQAAAFRQTLEAEIATRLPSKSPTVKPEVQAARILLKAMTVIKSPWSNLVDAPIQNAPGQRSASRYADVIDQFDLNSAELAGRYKKGGSGNEDTRCNVFAGDVMRAMGVPLPTKGNLGKGQGDKNSTYTDPMTAQASLLNDYLNQRLRWVTSAEDSGRLSDWVEVKPTTQGELNRLVAHVQAGKPALVSDAGHIAVIRPEQSAVTDWHQLTIAQAGASNLLYGPLQGHFFGTPQFFIHE